MSDHGCAILAAALSPFMLLVGCDAAEGSLRFETFAEPSAASDVVARSVLSLLHPEPPEDLPASASGVPAGSILWVIDRVRRQSNPWRFGEIEIDCPENAFCAADYPEIVGLAHAPADGCLAAVLVAGKGPLIHELVPVEGRLPEDRYRPAGDISDLRFFGVLRPSEGAPPTYFHARPHDPAGPFTIAETIRLAEELGDYCKSER